MDNWRTFASDWNSTSFDVIKMVSLHSDFYQRQTIVALLNAQQKAAIRMKNKGGHSACRQFVADIKASSWHDDVISIRFAERATGFDYEYMSYSRVCFRGNLTNIGDLASPCTISTGKHVLDTWLISYKLKRFKELFPELTHLWNFLNALTMAHFFHHACPINDTGLRRVEPLLKHHKVQFDQDAINIAFGNFSEIAKLEYSIHKLSVGKYCAYNLFLLAGDLTLMHVSLGIYQNLPVPVPVLTSEEVDILIG